MIGVGLVLSGGYSTIRSGEQTIPRQSLPPGASIILFPQTYYKYAMLLFYGDGGDGVRLNVRIGAELHQIDSDNKAISVVADNYLEITATNISTAEQSTPTIKISYITW